MKLVTTSTMRRFLLSVFLVLTKEVPEKDKTGRNVLLLIAASVVVGVGAVIIVVLLTLNISTGLTFEKPDGWVEMSEGELAYVGKGNEGRKGKYLCSLECLFV